MLQATETSHDEPVQCVGSHCSGRFGVSAKGGRADGGDSMIKQMKGTWLLGVAAGIVLLLAGVYFLQGSHAPSNQPPMVEMNRQALAGLQSEFNRTSAS